MNVLLSCFKHVSTDIKYKLFKAFCMSLYGCELWDLSSNHVNVFYITWKKCIRRLLGLPTMTHNILIHEIVHDIPAEGQIHTRFLKFIKKGLTSVNTCVRLCTTLMIQGSRSDAGKSLNFVCHKYNIDKYNIVNISNQVIDHKYFDCTTETATSAGNIIDLLYIRDNLKYYKFNLDDVQEMIDYLCLC